MSVPGVLVVLVGAARGPGRAAHHLEHGDTAGAHEPVAERRRSPPGDRAAGCAATLTDFQARFTGPLEQLLGWLNLLPALIGAFVGAPLLALLAATAAVLTLRRHPR